jgi:hypothetical protein
MTCPVAIQEIFEAYYDVFARDPGAAAENYGEPALMVSPGHVAVLNTRAEIAAQLGQILGRLKSEGYVRTELGEPRVTFLTDKTALFFTVARRLKDDGSQLEQAGYAYLLVDGTSGWKIRAAMSADVDRLATTG